MQGSEIDSSPKIVVIGRTTHVRFHFHQVTVSMRPSLAVGSPHWIPPIDLYETETEIMLEIGLAGVNSDEVNLEFAGRTVHISGRRADAVEPGPKNYYVMEIERGMFSRTIELPAFIEPETVRAHYRDGLLVVRVLKRGQQIRGCSQASTREGLE